MNMPVLVHLLRLFGVIRSSYGVVIVPGTSAMLVQCCSICRLLDFLGLVSEPRLIGTERIKLWEIQLSLEVTVDVCCY